MSRDKFAGDGFSVEVVDRNARRLITIGPDHAYWALEPGNYALAEEVTGAIVKVQPPPGASDEQVRLLQAALVKGECARARVLPWSRAKEAVVAHKAPMHERAGAREVVMSLAQASQRSEQVAPILEGLLAEVGL